MTADAGSGAGSGELASALSAVGAVVVTTLSFFFIGIGLRADSLLEQAPIAPIAQIVKTPHTLIA